jgi:hypothetical protein
MIQVLVASLVTGVCGSLGLAEWLRDRAYRARLADRRRIVADGHRGG